MKKATIVGLLFIAMLWPIAGASAATVSVVPRVSPTNPGVQFKTQYGYVNSTNNQIYNLIRVQPDGIIYFDVHGLELIQVTYSFVAKGYGNGTMTMQFAGGRPVLVQTSGVKSYSGGIESISYSSAMTDSFLLVAYEGSIFGVSSNFLYLVPLGMELMGAGFVAVPLFLWSRNREENINVPSVIVLVVGVILIFTGVAVVNQIIASGG